MSIVPFLIIVIKLSRYKYGDVGNLRKFEYLYGFFRHSLNAWKCDLTSNLILFRPVMKVRYRNKCKYIFYFKWMGLFLVSQ